MFVKEVKAKLIRNSRGNKTIEITLFTYEGKFSCSAPSGKSIGKNAVPIYNKAGIDKSLRLFNSFSRKLIHQNFIIKKIEDLSEVNTLMRRFEAKFGRIGANFSYALEGALLRAAAADAHKQVWELINDDVNEGIKPKMPMPVGNCIGGGVHSAKIKGKRPDFQEFLLIPGAKTAKTFSRAVTVNIRAYEFARTLLKSRARNDEGAWLTHKTNEEALDILKEVSKKFNLRIGLDIAASTFYDKGYYNYQNKSLIRDKVDQADYIERLIKKYRIFYVEDPMHEEDFSGFKEVMNAVIGKNQGRGALIIGDDLTTTNIKYARRAVEGGAINAMIIKPNQIGSLIEVKKVVQYCKKHKIIMIFSHRSGETMDDILSDYCIGFGGHYLKAGIFGRTRLIKLKRIMDIEKVLRNRV